MRFFKDDDRIYIDLSWIEVNTAKVCTVLFNNVSIGTIVDMNGLYQARWYVYPCKDLVKEFSAPELSIILLALAESFELDSIFRIKFNV